VVAVTVVVVATVGCCGNAIANLHCSRLLSLFELSTIAAGHQSVVGGHVRRSILVVIVRCHL